MQVIATASSQSLIGFAIFVNAYLMEGIQRSPARIGNVELKPLRGDADRYPSKADCIGA